MPTTLQLIPVWFAFAAQVQFACVAVAVAIIALGRAKSIAAIVLAVVICVARLPPVPRPGPEVAAAFPGDTFKPNSAPLPLPPRPTSGQAGAEGGESEAHASLCKFRML